MAPVRKSSCHKIQHKWSRRNAADRECKCQKTLQMSRATVRLYGNTRTHRRARMCAHMHIHWPSGLLQQPARNVIRSSNQAEAEECLPFISRCAALLSLSPRTLPFYSSLCLSLFGSNNVYQCLEPSTNAKYVKIFRHEIQYQWKILLSSLFSF